MLVVSLDTGSRHAQLESKDGKEGRKRTPAVRQGVPLLRHSGTEFVNQRMSRESAQTSKNCPSTASRHNSVLTFRLSDHVC